MQDNPIRVYEGMALVIADSFHLGTDTLRVVYRGDDPDQFILEYQTELESQGFRIRNYSCDNDQHTAEIRAAHPGLRSLDVLGIASDIYMEYRETRASLTVETGNLYVTAHGGQITWTHKEAERNGQGTGGGPDPADAGTTGRADGPGSGTGSSALDPGQQERQDLPGSSPAL